MATFCGVIVCGVHDEGDFYAKAKELGVERLRDGSGVVTIDTSASFIDPSEKLARELSALDGVERVFALFGQSAADGYVVAENVRGEVVRRVLYNRDYGGWETSGAARAWEADLPVEREPVDEEDDDARMTYGKLTALATKLGWDFDAGPHARHAKRGVFARIFKR